jgi:N-acetylmuramic acid 6-phosphate etherase
MSGAAPRRRKNKVTTEAANRAAANLDAQSALEIARIIHDEDTKVAGAITRALPAIARAIDAIVEALGRGGRLIYVGAGTSGRIAALDAVECPPTFNTDPAQVRYVIAGGEKALGAAFESEEDSRAQGRRDMEQERPGRNDVVVGVSASGRTPYTVAAVEYARSRGARTFAVVNNRGSELASVAQGAIVAETGPEVVAGSTRMKAGTAQKMILNMLSTGAMVRLGYVYGNRMVNVHLSNEKLMQRGTAIVQSAAQVERALARRVLQEAGSVPVALVMLKRGISKHEAERLLAAVRGNVRRAIEERPK